MENQTLLKFLIERHLNRGKYFSLLGAFLIVIYLSSCKNRNESKDYAFLHESTYFKDNLYDSTITDYQDMRKKIIKKKGLLSLEKIYLSNGKLGSYIEMYNDSIVGNAYWFYQTGSLKHYGFADEYHNVCYVLKYDSLGSIIKDEGVPVSPNITWLDRDAKNDSIIFWTSVPSPPYTHTDIYGGIMNVKGNIIDSEWIPLRNNFVTYSKSIPVKDSFVIFFRGIIYNNNGDIIQEKTVKGRTRIFSPDIFEKRK